MNWKHGLLLISLIVNAHIPVYQLLLKPLHIEVGDQFFEPILFSNWPLLWISAIILFSLSVWRKLTLRMLIGIQSLRWLVALLICISAWPFLFYDYNFYFDQWHFYDRLFLGLLAIASCQYPLLIFPLLMQLSLMHSQFNFPFGGNPFLDKSMPFELLAITWTTVFVLTIFKRVPMLERVQSRIPMDQILVYMLLVVAGACYYHSGIEKLEISPNGWEWPFYNDLTYNIMAMHNRGWLAAYPELHAFIVRVYSFIQTPGQVIILIGELAFVLILFNQKVARWIIGVMIVLHIGVFVMNGALFWMWILADLGLLWYLSKKDIRMNWKTGLLGALIIHCSIFLLEVKTLGWYDSGLDNRFELCDQNNRVLSNATLSPYTAHFQIGNFRPILDYKTLNPGFLIFELERAEEVAALTTQTADHFIQQYGSSHFNPYIVENMTRFLQAFLAHQKENPVQFLQPPAYWNAHVTDQRPRPSAASLDEINLYHRQELNTSGMTEVISRKLILTVHQKNADSTSVAR